MMQAEEHFFEENKREYSRVDAYIGMECSLREPQDIENVCSRISGETFLSGFESPDCRTMSAVPGARTSGGTSEEFGGPPGLEDPSLTEWIKVISAKLDTVIRILTMQNEGFLRLPFSRVNIGGGGMSFKSQKPYAPGDLLEIKVMLHMNKPVALYLYGEVLETKRLNGDSEVAVKFILMDDRIRDEIVRFVFEREREILREKRR